LVEGQEKNIAQLERIGTVIEQKWSSVGKEKNRDDMKGSENSPGESQEKGTPLSIVRHGSHQGGSLQNGLRDERTCGMTLASAYMLCHLSAA